MDERRGNVSCQFEVTVDCRARSSGDLDAVQGTLEAAGALYYSVTGLGSFFRTVFPTLAEERSSSGVYSVSLMADSSRTRARPLDEPLLLLPGRLRSRMTWRRTRLSPTCNAQNCTSSVTEDGQKEESVAKLHKHSDDAFVYFTFQLHGSMKIVGNAAGRCELKLQSVSDHCWDRSDGEETSVRFALCLASKELALNFKDVLEGAEAVSRADLRF